MRKQSQISFEAVQFAVNELLSWYKTNQQADSHLLPFFANLQNWHNQSSQGHAHSTGDAKNRQQLAIKELFAIIVTAMIAREQNSPAIWFPRMLLIELFTHKQIMQHLKEQSKHVQTEFQVKYIVTKEFSALANNESENGQGSTAAPGVGFFNVAPMEVRVKFYRKLPVDKIFELKKSTENRAQYFALMVALFTQRGEKACQLQDKIMTFWLSNERQRNWIRSLAKKYTQVKLDFIGCMQDIAGDDEHKMYCMLMLAEIDNAITKELVDQVKVILRGANVIINPIRYSVLAQWLISKEPAFAAVVNDYLDQQQPLFQGLVQKLKHNTTNAQADLLAYAYLVRSVSKVSDKILPGQLTYNFFDSMSCVVSDPPIFKKSCELIAAAWRPLVLAKHLFVASAAVFHNSDASTSIEQAHSASYGLLVSGALTMSILPTQLFDQLLRFADRQLSREHKDNAYVALYQVMQRIPIVPDYFRTRFVTRALNSPAYRAKLLDLCGVDVYNFFSEAERDALANKTIAVCKYKTAEGKLEYFENAVEYKLIYADSKYYGAQVFRQKFTGELQSLLETIIQMIEKLIKNSNFVLTIEELEFFEIFSRGQQQRVADAYLGCLVSNRSEPLANPLKNSKKPISALINGNRLFQSVIQFIQRGETVVIGNEAMLPTSSPSMLKKSLFPLLDSNQLLWLTDWLLQHGEYKMLCKLNLQELSAEHATIAVRRIGNKLVSVNDVPILCQLLVVHTNLFDLLDAVLVEELKGRVSRFVEFSRHHDFDDYIHESIIYLLMIRLSIVGNDSGLKSQFLAMSDDYFHGATSSMRYQMLKKILSDKWLCKKAIDLSATFMAAVDNSDALLFNSLLDIMQKMIYVTPRRKQQQLLLRFFDRSAVIADHIKSKFYRELSTIDLQLVDDELSSMLISKLIELTADPSQADFFKVSAMSVLANLMPITFCEQSCYSFIDRLISMLSDPVQPASVKILAISVLVKLNRKITCTQLQTMLLVLIHQFNETVVGVDNTQLAFELFAKLIPRDQLVCINTLCDRLRVIPAEDVRTAPQLLVGFVSFFYAQHFNSNIDVALDPVNWSSIPYMTVMQRATLQLIGSIFMSLKASNVPVRAICN